MANYSSYKNLNPDTGFVPCKGNPKPSQNCTMEGQQPKNEIQSKIEDSLNKTSYVFLGIGWLLNGFIAYKFWNKSNLWKAGILAVAGINLYYTYDFIQKRKKSSQAPKGNGVEAPKGELQKDETQEKDILIKQFIKDLEQAKKPLTESQKKNLEKTKSLSVKEMKILFELQKEQILSINQNDSMESVLKKMSEITKKFEQKYGKEMMEKIGEKINNLGLNQ